MTDTALAISEEVETFRPSAAIDPQRLDYLWTLAERMAQSTLVPESLKTTGPKSNKKDLPHEAVVANVFAVVEQADRWNISPWALLACAAIVHGRLGFEGKVISAVLKSRYGIDLEYEWSGEGENRKIVISGRKPGSGRVLTVEGLVKDWKTSGEGSPWRPATFDKMLAYRGAREFARLHEPSAILGVLGDDEILAIGMDRQAQLARDITPVLADRFGGARGEGFNAGNIKQIGQGGQVPMERIDRLTGEVIESGAQRGSMDKTTSAASTTSAKPTSDDAGRGGESSRKDSRPTNSDATGQSPSPDRQSTGGGAESPSNRAASDSSSSKGHASEDAAGQRRPADTFRSFARAMARMTTPENVDKASKEFWSKNGGFPEKGSADYDLGALIYGKQSDRAHGRTDAEGLLEEIDADIEKSFGEGEL